MEQPYFIVTNLEYSYAFGMTLLKKASLPKCFPGLLENMRFDEAPDENYFIDALSRHFREYLNFSENCYEYMATPGSLKNFSNRAVDDKTWKSGLAQLLYEYIRGALDGSGNILPINPVVSFREICLLSVTAARGWGLSGFLTATGKTFILNTAFCPISWKKCMLWEGRILAGIWRRI